MAVPLPRCAFFHGEVDKPAHGFLHRGGRKPVVVAISLEGVHVIDSREKVPPASPGWDLGWGSREPHWRGHGVLTRAFLLLAGWWLARRQTGWPVWLPSPSGGPWGFQCHPGSFLGVCSRSAFLSAL